MYGIEDLEEVLGELRARREGEAKKAQDVALPGVGSGLPRVRPVERGSRQDDQNRFRGRSRRLWVAAASSHPSLDPHQAKRNKREIIRRSRKPDSIPLEDTYQALYGFHSFSIYFFNHSFSSRVETNFRPA